MADGKWVFAGVVDAAADNRQLLAEIVAGRAGGPPSVIGHRLVSDFRGVAFKPMQFGIAGLARSSSRELSDRLGARQGDACAWVSLDDDLVGRSNNGHFAPFAWAA